MINFSYIERYLPYFLPLLLIFSRTLADFTVIFVSLAFIFRSYLYSDFSWLREPLLKYFFIFYFYLIFINSFLSIDIFDSLSYSLSFIRWPIFSIALAIWIFSTKKSLNKLFLSIIITLIIYFFLLWYAYFFNSAGIFGFSENNINNRLSVPFSNNVIPGRFIVFFTFALLAIYFCKNKLENVLIHPLLFFFIIITGFITTFMTGERMSLLIFTSASLLSLIAYYLNNKNNIKIICLIFLAIFAILIFFSYFDNEIFHRNLISVKEKIINLEASDYGQVFNVSINKWQNNILFGGGLHQFKFIEPMNNSLDFDYSSIYHAHNLVLNLLVETGVIGLFLFYLIIYILIKNCIKTFRFKKDFNLLLLNLNLIYICFFPLHTHFKLSHNWINASVWFCMSITLITQKLYEKEFRK